MPGAKCVRYGACSSPAEARSAGRSTLIREPHGWADYDNAFDCRNGGVVRGVRDTGATAIGAAQHHARPAARSDRALSRLAPGADHPGTQDGLYWPVTKGQKRSPLGELLAQAAQGRSAPGRSQELRRQGGHVRRVFADCIPACDTFSPPSRNEAPGSTRGFRRASCFWRSSRCWFHRP